MRITKRQLKQIIKEELSGVLSEEQPAWWPHPEQDDIDPDVQSTLSPMPGQPGKQWNEQEAYELAKIDNPDLPSYDEYATARSAVDAEAERELLSRPDGRPAHSAYQQHRKGRAMAKLGAGWILNLGDLLQQYGPMSDKQRAIGDDQQKHLRRGYEAGMARKAKAETPAVPMKENRRRKVRKTRRK